MHCLRDRNVASPRLEAYATQHCRQHSDCCIYLHIWYSCRLRLEIVTSSGTWRRVGLVWWNLLLYLANGGTRWRSWLMHCATSRKVTGSIPDGVTGIFHWHNPSGRTMALGLTQPLTEMNTRNISWGKRRSVRRAENLTTFMRRLSSNVGASTSCNPLGLYRLVMELLYLTLKIDTAHSYKSRRISIFYMSTYTRRRPF